MWQPAVVPRRRAGRLLLAVALVIVFAWWVGPAHTWDGPVLVSLSASHGIHAGDLPAVPLLVAAGWLALG